MSASSIPCTVMLTVEPMVPVEIESPGKRIVAKYHVRDQRALAAQPAAASFFVAVLFADSQA